MICEKCGEDSDKAAHRLLITEHRGPNHWQSIMCLCEDCAKRVPKSMQLSGCERSNDGVSSADTEEV